MGDLAYDPASVRALVAIIRGEWDHRVTDADVIGSSMHYRVHGTAATSRSAAVHTSYISK